MGEPHEIRLSGYKASTLRNRTLDFGTYGSYGIEKLNVILESDWADSVVTAIFSFNGQEKTALVPSGGGIVDVPPEATLHPLSISECGKITFRGVKEGVQIYSTSVQYTVSGHETDDVEAPDATPSAWEQFVNTVQKDAGRAEEAANKAESSLTDVANAKSEALTAIDDAKNASVSEASKQIDSLKDESLTEASKGIDDAKNDAITAVGSAGNAQIQAITDAGNTTIEKVVQEGDTQVGRISELILKTYTKEESDERYAPIKSALTVSGTGEDSAILQPTISWNMQGLKVYARSTTDPTPSIDNPVPIAYAGKDGFVEISVSGENEESKQIIRVPVSRPFLGVYKQRSDQCTYKDEKGQYWASDWIDFTTGMMQIGLLDYFSKEEVKSWKWNYREWDFRPNYSVATFTHSTNIYLNSTFLCSNAKMLTNSDEEGISCGSGNLVYKLNKSRLIPYGFIDDGEYHAENLQPFLDWMADQPLFEFAIVLAPNRWPEPQPIPQDIMDEYRKLVSMNSKTKVESEHTFVIGAALANATEYIDQKIAELSSAILEG